MVALESFTNCEACNLYPVFGSAPTPRAIAVQVVDTNPAQARCSTPGKARETFTFPASDQQGPGNIQTIQGSFVIADSNHPAGSPANTTNGCAFQFNYGGSPTSPANVLYLVGAIGSGSSTVGGTGATDLTNGYCTIHTSSASSQVTADSNDTNNKILGLTLDIEFLSGTTSSTQPKYIYTLVTNQQNQSSNGGNWSYWGWWMTPNP